MEQRGLEPPAPSPRRFVPSQVKNSAEKSRRRKANPFRSALSMLTFYINRAGKSLPESQRKRLEKAKDRLRQHFHKGKS